MYGGTVNTRELKVSGTFNSCSACEKVPDTFGPSVSVDIMQSTVSSIVSGFVSYRSFFAWLATALVFNRDTHILA